MATPASQRAFSIFHFVLGSGILLFAARTAVDSLTGAHSLPPLLVVGAGIEALGAALFIFPRTLRVGGTIMLFAMTTVLVLDGLSRRWRIDLLIYLAGTYYVMVHGAWGTRSSAPSMSNREPLTRLD
jgi:hypothetical protein